MRLASRGRPHLTYCTNIHSGESWPEVRANLEQYVLAVKARVSPERRFGVGLRLSTAAAAALSAPAELSALREFLRANHLYVFTLAGYSPGLARILAELLPEEPGLEGSITTELVDGMSRHLLNEVAALHDLAERTGKLIALALEPSYPRTMLGTVRFFEEHLVSKSALAHLSGLTKLSAEQAELAVRRHLGVCVDACNLSLAFEEPRSALYTLVDAGLRVTKVQISSTLRTKKAAQLRALELIAGGDGAPHQVVEKSGEQLTTYDDISQAVVAAEREPKPESEWRIRFRVPIHSRALGPVRNTQVDVQKLLDTLREDGIAEHLEVADAEHRGGGDVVDCIARELQWAVEEMGS